MKITNKRKEDDKKRLVSYKELEIANSIATEQLLKEVNIVDRINKTLLNTNYRLIIKNKKILSSLEILEKEVLDYRNVFQLKNMIKEYIKQTRNFFENG